MRQFHNPVLSGFNPDPSICRVGDTYYLATSSFEYLPGLPIYESTDLRNWKLVGHVGDRPGQIAAEQTPTGAGAWAPTIRHHDGRFWLVITIVGQGAVVYTAERAAGPWSDPVSFAGLNGIDPDIAWDADGNCYLTFSGLILSGEDVGKHLGIQQVRVNPLTGELLEEPRSLWSGTGHMFPEAPHLYEIDGTWYLMIAEGGTERGHGVSIARGDSPMGPFEAHPANPVLSARSTSRPIQNTGHGDLVQTPDGDWLMFMLGMRTRGATRAFSPMGRETFATTLTWVDGWPVVEPVLLDDPAPAVSEVDGFTSPSLDDHWIGVRRFPATIADLSSRFGWLTMLADGGMDAQQPCFIGQRQRHELMNLTTLVDVGNGAGGLALRIDEEMWVSVVADGEQVRVQVKLAQITKEWTQPWNANEAVLYIETTHLQGFVFNPAAHAPDTIHLGYFDGDEKREVAAIDGRFICAETGASFVGRAWGLFAEQGTVAFDWVEYEGVDGTR